VFDSSQSTHLQDGPDLLDGHALLGDQLVQEEVQRLCVMEET
jgi:hypothetical protein